MKNLLPWLLLLVGHAGAPTRHVASAPYFHCPAHGNAVARDVYVTPVHENDRYQLKVQFKYPGGGEDYNFTADWVRPALGSDPHDVTFEYHAFGMGDYHAIITVPNDELVAGEIHHMVFSDGANPYKGPGGGHSVNPCEYRGD
jgi:hypothetical protein